ncbi:MAG: hypothetical protein N3G21_07960 [Candidatus Hydrogenedentes bacterium]|nr:hypothetical protein [Candidatus Hydrogenedentota bacterium]
MDVSAEPSFFQVVLWELQKFSRDHDLRYLVPSLTILLIIGMVLLKRKFVVAYLGETLSGFFRGVLVGILLICAFLATGNYIDSFGQWRYGTFFNAYEFYHYYMGSKYAREIGYTRLYAGSLIADEETGRKYSNPQNTIRNLATGAYISVDEVLKNKDQYKSFFSNVRWEEWKKDIQFFKRELTTSRWNNVLRDKGYNATPVWSMLIGGFLSNPISTDNRNHMLMLASLDLILIGATVLVVALAFGIRPALFMVILIGTHYMMRFSHMKGAFLRTDYAMTLVLSACMIKMNRYRLAGFFTAYSFLSRIFPGVYLFGPGARLFWDLCKMVRIGYDEIKIKFYSHTQRVIVVGVIVGVNLILSLVGAGVVRLLPPSIFEGFTIPWPLPIVWHLLVFVPICFFALMLFWAGLWGYFTRRMERDWVNYFITFGCTVAILFIASFCYYGGLDQWRDYADKIGRHNKDISPWRVGYKYIFIAQFPQSLDFKKSIKDLIRISFDALLGRPITMPDATNQGNEGKTQAQSSKKGNPIEITNFSTAFKKVVSTWKPYTKSAIYREQARRWWATMLIVLILCLIASRKLSPYESFVFGFVPCFFLVSPTYYYYIMLAVPLLFFTPKIDNITRAVAVIWLYISAMAGYYFYTMWEQEFPTYFWLGCMLFVLAIYMLILAMCISMPEFVYRGLNLIRDEIIYRWVKFKEKIISKSFEEPSS